MTAASRSALTPIQRVEAVLAGQRPDRPPVSFWYHFPAEQHVGAAAVQAHLAHLETYGLDFLKVMNDNPYPHGGLIRDIADLASLGELRGDEEGFGRQLEVLSSLRDALRGRVWMTTTIFNAWATLRGLIAPPEEHLPPTLDAAADAPSRWIRDAYDADPDAVTQALGAIGQNLARFATRCIQAGADGVFLSVRDDWVEAPGRVGLYDKLVRPTDLQILAAAGAGRFNVLHVCGRAMDFPAMAEYPVQAINWADRAAGPPIAAVRDWLVPAICAGVDNLTTLVTGSPEDVAREVHDTMAQAAPRPLMIAPGCTFDPRRVPRANLEALVAAVRTGGRSADEP